MVRLRLFKSQPDMQQRCSKANAIQAQGKLAAMQLSPSTYVQM